MTQQKIQGKNLVTVFKSFDKDNSGFIDLNELKAIVEEMGEKMTQQQLQKVIQQIDTNGDRKISFQEFKYWWTHAKTGKLTKVVGLKFKALKLLNVVGNTLSSSKINLNQKYQSGLNSHEVKIGFGNDQGKFSFGTEIIVLGEQFKAYIQQMKKLIPNLMQHSVSLIFTIKTSQPHQLKKLFDQFIAQIKSQFGQDTLFTQLLSIFNIITIPLNNKILIAFQTINNQHTASLLAIPQQILSALGEKFQIKFSLNFKIKEGIKQAYSEIKFIKWLCKGFSLAIRIQTNGQFLKNIRKFLLEQLNTEDQQKTLVTLLCMLHNSKFNIKLKHPEDIDKLFESLVINQLSQTTPNFQVLLDQLAKQYGILDWKNKQNKYHHLFKIMEFISNNADDQINFAVLFPFALIKVHFKLPGGSILFRNTFKLQGTASTSNPS